MEVKELIELLRKQPQTGKVFINGVEVDGVEVVLGRSATGYAVQYFTPNPKGRVTGVTFTHMAEQSDGVMRPSYFWNPCCVKPTHQ
jgi:hypothetical protein